MIVTDKFVHYHLPRTGGSAFSELCHRFLLDEIQHEEKTFSWMVPKDFDNGLLDIITFRMLPSWIMSYNISQIISQKTLNQLKTVKNKTAEGKIIYEKEWYYVDDIYGDKLRCINLRNTIAIRQENLLQDFDKMLQSLYGRSLRGYRLPNTYNKLNYPKFNLSKEDIETIYNSNPIWQKIESRIYD